MSEMPKQIIRNNFKDGFLIASFGMFTDAKLDAGTSFEIENYNMHINGGFDLYGGHTDNAENKKIFFNLSSDYVAPQKFWLFGGSKTTTTLKIRDNAYNTYGADSVAERKSVNINFDVDVDGNYEGFSFQTGMGVDIFEISQNNFTKDAF